MSTGLCLGEVTESSNATPWEGGAGMPQRKSDLKTPSSLTQSPRRRAGQRRSPYRQSPCTLRCPQVTCPYTCPHLASFLQSLPGDKAFVASLSRELWNFRSSPGAARAKVPGFSTIRPGEAAEPGGHVCFGGGYPLASRSFLGHHLPETRPLPPRMEGLRAGPAQLGRVFPGLAV